MLHFLRLPLFFTTLFAILLKPLTFFRDFHALVTNREGRFFDINAEKEGDPYLGPVKFAALAIVLSNLLFPFTLSLGVQVGAVSQEFVAFADWAKETGYLDPIRFTGIGFIDKFLRDILALIVFYGLGVLISLYSGGIIPFRFAAGYFYYWNAWSVLSAFVGIAMILVSFFIPLYQTGFPMIVDLGINLISMFMFIGFPILFWPRFIDISMGRAAIAVIGGLATWIAAIAIIVPLFVTMPEFG